MVPPAAIAVALAFALTYYAGIGAVKGVKWVDRKVCHVITLGHKCKPITPPIVKPGA